MNIVDALKKVKNDLLNFIIENLSNKSDVTHTHDEYATDEYVDKELSKKADSSHIHEEYLEASDVEDLATEEYVIKKIAEASLAESNVDLSCYYTKTETDKAIDAAVEAIDEAYKKANEELTEELAKAVLYVEQELTEEQKAQARKNIGVIVNPDIHAEYFTITDDGVISLKPEYRGASSRLEYPDAISDLGFSAAGSKNTELPEHLIIPEIVNKKAVVSLADGMFLRNYMIKNVTLPVTINKISERCFDNAHNLLNVYNTENIKTIGKCAFQRTSVERLNLPKLEQLEDTSTFQNVGNLIYINVGKVKALPDKTFNNCYGLNMVKSSNEINSVGSNCFSITPNLKQASFISNLTDIGEAAFMTSGVDFDWSTLDNCTFGTDATPLQYNPTDFWSACTVVPCENELPTLLSQHNPRWVDRYIGTSDVSYVDGCFLMCLLHAYCGLHNLSLESVTEFEEIANNIDANLLNTYTMSARDFKQFAEKFNLTVEEYSTINQTVLQTLYDSLANGKYAVLTLCGQETSLAHTILVYGVTDNGELLIADSSGLIHNNQNLAFTYHLPYKNLTSANYFEMPKLWILSL